MSTNAIVYMNPALPIRVENVDRLVYLPDGSQHLLDVHDRPLFTAPAGTGVVIIMEYAKNEDAKPEQVAPFAREQHKQKQEIRRREEVATEKTQQIEQIRPDQRPDVVNVNPQGGVAPVVTVAPVMPVVTSLQQRTPFPRVAEFGPRPMMKPGDVTVRSAAEVPNDVTGEMVVPDFPGAPKGAIREQREESSSPQSPEQGATEQTSEPGRAAS